MIFLNENNMIRQIHGRTCSKYNDNQSDWAPVKLMGYLFLGKEMATEKPLFWWQLSEKKKKKEKKILVIVRGPRWLYMAKNYFADIQFISLDSWALSLSEKKITLQINWYPSHQRTVREKYSFCMSKLLFIPILIIYRMWDHRQIKLDIKKCQTQSFV